ncbi:SGNH/GDSL hydrolase family protein [Mycoplasma zalophi]|uniref:SGNH/GDSL hydrolase family protein n=1 Tax=Mycoplasma zalophi TaxID=191287 RepID=A0ABS6DPV0_9MOLU|nr:SGNH/GDSL hydrolase family protein [Mycoplasma zalophi]MBU4692347.1 SGNH/GDSL hydrolase family protein [Mycoplasma zalophi]
MKKSAKITLAFLSIVAATSIVTPLSIILTKPTQQQINPKVEKNQKSDVSTLEGDIHYVAIGDSIAAGFNAKFGYDQGGYLNVKTNKIEGLSYPSYLANAIKMTNDRNTKLASYTNFGLTGTTVDDWLYLLDPLSYDKNSSDYHVIQNRLAFDLSIDKSPKNPIKMYAENRLEYLFNDFQVTNNEVGKLASEIKNANLLTISLGANDYLSYVDLFDLISVLSMNDSEISDADIQNKYDKFIKESAKFKEDITKKYSKLLTKLREINPELNINIISYPMPFVRIANMIDKKYAKVQENFSDFVINSLNNVLRDIALENNINYINSFNKELWKAESKELASNIFDIHPDILGYKKMAQDIFLKMSYNPNRENNEQKEITEFEKSDQDAHKQVINFKDYTNNEIKLLIYGVYALNNNTFDVSYDFENNTINQNIMKFIALNPNIDIETILENYLAKDDLIFNSDQVKTYIKNALSNIGFKLENFPNFEKMIDNIIKQNAEDGFLKHVVIEFINTGIFGKIFNQIKRKVEALIDSKPSEYIESSEIEKIITDTVFDQKIIYDSLRKFVLSDFFKQNDKNKTLKQIILSLLTDFVNEKNFIPALGQSSKAFAKIIYSNQNIVSDIVDKLKEIVSEIVDNYPRYFEDSPNLVDFLAKVYESNSLKINEIVNIIINSITNNTESINLITNILLDKIEYRTTKKLSDIDRQKVQYFLEKLINNFKNKPFFENVISKFVDLVFKNINKPNINIDSIITLSLTSTILDSYPGNENGEIVISLLSDNLDDEKYVEGMRVLIQSVADKNYLENLNISEFVQNNSTFNFEKLKTIFLNVINNDNINNNQKVKDNLKLFVKYLLESNILNNNLINQFIAIYSEGNIINRLYEQIDFLNITEKLNIDLSAENGLKNALTLWFKSLVNDLFADDELKTQIISSFSNIIDNLDKLKGKDLNEILINTIKNIKILKPKKLVNKFIKVIVKNGNSKDLAIKILTSILKEYSQLQISNEQLTLLNENISKVLENISDSKLLSDLLDLFENIDFSSANTFESIYSILVEQLKNYFDVSQINIINNILSVIVAKDSNNVVHVGIDKWLIALKPIFTNDNFINFVFEKIDLNKTVDQLFKKIDISDKNWDQNTVDNFNNFISQSKDIILANLSNWSKTTVKSIFDTIFSDQSIETSKNSPSEWFKEYVIKNLVSKVSNLSKVILNEIFTNQEYKHSALVVVSQIIKEYLKPYIDITEEQAKTLTTTLEKILNNLNNEKFINTISEELTNAVAKIVVLSDDVVLSINFKGDFQIDKIFELLKEINIEQFVDLLDEEDIKNLLEIINNNKEQLFNKLNEQTTTNNTPEDTENTENNTQTNTNSLKGIEKIIYRIVPKLVKKINSSSSAQEISKNIKEILVFILENQQSHNFLKTTLKNIYPETKNTLNVSKDSWNSFVDYLAEQLLQNTETTEFIKSLVDSIFVNNKQEISEVKNIFELFKQVVKLNKDSVSKYIKWLSKEEKLKEFLADVVFGLLNKIADFTSIENNFKTLFKNVISNIDDSELINVVLNKFIDTLNAITLDDPTDLSSLFGNNFLTKFNISEIITTKNAKWILTNIFSEQNKNDLNVVVEALLDGILKKSTSNTENSENSESTENTSQNNLFDIWTLIKKFANTLSKTDDSQVINNIVSTIQTIASKFINNKLNLDNVSFLNNENKLFISKIIDNSLKDENVTEILKTIAEEFLTTTTHQNTENLETFINNVLKNNFDKIAENIKKLITKTLKVSQNQNDLFEILINLLNSKLETKVDQTTKANLKEIYVAILNNIDKMPILDELIKELKSIISENDVLKPGLIFNDKIVEILQSIFTNKDKLISFANKQNIRPILVAIFNADRSDKIVEIIDFFIKAKWIKSQDKETNSATETNETTSQAIPDYVLDILKAFSNVLDNSTDSNVVENITKVAVKFVQKYLTETIDISKLTDIFTKPNQDNVKDILVSISNDEEFSKLLKNILTDYMTTNKYTNVSNISEFINHIVKNNAETSIENINKIIKNVLTDTENTEKLTSILINIIENKLNNTLDENTKASVKKVFNKLYAFVSNDGILNSLKTTILSFVKSNDLLDENVKLNSNLVNELIKLLTKQETINNLLSKENIKQFLETFFNENINQDILKVVNFFVSSSQKETTDSSNTAEENTDNQTEKIDFEQLLLKILQNASNIYTQDNKNNNVINNVSELITLITKDLVDSKLNLDKITILDDNSKQKTKEIVGKILELKETKDLLVKLFENYFTNNQYESLESISKIVNALVKNNLQIFKEELTKISKAALKDENIKANLKEIAIQIIEKSLNIDFNTQVENNLKDIIDSIILFASENNVLDKLFSSLEDTLKNKDILLEDKTLNPEVINSLKELFTSETIIQKLLTKESFKAFISKLFTDENKVKIINVLEAIINSKWTTNSNETSSDSDAETTNEVQENNQSKIINWIFNVAKLASGSLGDSNNQNINNINEVLLFVAKQYVQKQLNLSNIDILSSNSQNILKNIILSTLNLNEFKGLTNKVLSNFFTTQEYNNSQDIYKLVNKLVKNNINNISDDAEKTIYEIIKLNQQDHNLSALIININETKLEKEIPKEIKLALQNIIELATKEINRTTFITELFKILKEVLNSNDIFDANNQFNKEILNSISTKLQDETNLESLFSNTNIQHVLNNLLTQDNLDKNIEEIIKIYKWFRFNDFSKSTKENSEESTESDSTNTQNLVNFDLIAKIIKSANGILEGNNSETLKQNIKKLLKEIAKVEITEANFSKVVNGKENADKLKNLLTKVVDYNSLDKMLDTILIKYLDKTYDLSSANDINEIIKQYLSNAKNGILDNIKEFINELINTDKELLDEFIINAIDKQLINKLTSENKQTIKNISTRIFNFVKENESYKTILGHLIDALKEIDFIKDGQIDSELIKDTIAKKFNFDTILSLVTKENASSLLNNLFNDDSSVNDFVELYKTLRSNINFSSKTTDNQANTSENSNNKGNSQQTNKSSLFDFIAKILKTLNGSLNNEDASSRVSQTISKILKYELTKFDAQEFNINGIFKIETINKVLHSIGNSAQLEDAVSKIVKHYLHVSDSDIQNATNLNDVIKAIIKFNLEELKKSLIEILSFGVSENNNENFIAKDIFNYLNKTYNLEFTETSAEVTSFIAVVSKTIDTLTNKDYFKTLFNSILDQAADLDFFVNNEFNANLLPSLLEKILTKTQWNTILTKEFGKDFINILIEDKDLTTDTDQINEQQSEKIFNLYKFIKKLILNIQNQASSENSNNTGSSSTNTTSDEQNTQKYRNIEDLILKIFMSFNNSLEGTTHGDQKLKIIQKALHKVIKDVAVNIDLSSIIASNPNINKEEIQKLLGELVSYDSVETFTNKIAEDILKTDVKTWKEYEDGKDSTLPKLMSLIIEHEKDAIITLLKDTLTEFFKKKENADNVTKLIFKFMKVENTTNDDINLLSGVLQKLVPKLLNNNWFNKKILLRSFWWLSKKALEFKIEQPTKWISDAFAKVMSAIGEGDIGVILDFVGDNPSQHAITSLEFTKLINLFFEKSNFEDSLLYNGLRNLNTDPDKSKRTNKQNLDDMVGNSAWEAIGKLIAIKPKAAPTPSDENPDYMVSSDKTALDILDKVYKTISKVYWQQNLPEDAVGYSTRRQNFAYKALYRVYTTVNYAVFQMYFRETTDSEREQKFIRWWFGSTGNPPILWILLEDNVLGLKRLNKTLKASFESPRDIWPIRNELNVYAHYLKASAFEKDRYADEKNYRPDDIIYILTTSEFPDNDPNKNKYDKNVYFGPQINKGKSLSKKEYVLWTIREGSWGRFMNEAGETSLNIISGFAEWQNKGSWWSPNWQIVPKIGKGKY